MDTVWLLESLPCAVVVFSAKGAVCHANPQLAELTGHDLQGLLDDSPPLAELIEVEDRQQVLDARAEGDVELRYRLRRKSGECILVQERGTWREHEGQRLLVATLENACARGLSEAHSLQQARLHALGQLSAGVAHEVNNQLAGVLNYTQLALRLDPSEKLRGILEGVEASGQRVLETTQALLSFAGSDSEALSTVVPAEVVRACFTLLRRRLRDEHVLFSTETDPALPMMAVRGRPLQQVLLQLLENSRWALHERYPGRDPDKKLIVRARPEGEHVVFEVEDHGVGLPEGDLFQAFCSTRPGALGLGLTTARLVVEEHSGSLELSARPEGGTIARVRFPTTP